MKRSSKCFRNKTKIDAKTHDKSMPKLVTNESIRFIKNHVFSNGRIIQIHCKNNGFWRFNRLRARTEISSKIYKNRNKIHPETDVKSIGVRGRKMDAQNNGKTLKIESKRQPKSSNMQQKRVQKSMSKNAEWKSTGTPVREPTGEAIPASAPGSLGLIY